jgi:translation initiation factor SUI1
MVRLSPPTRFQPHPLFLGQGLNFGPACNGTIIQDTELGEVIQLQGDHRTKVFDFLTNRDKDKMGKYALPKDSIKIHGF